MKKNFLSAAMAAAILAAATQVAAQSNLPQVQNNQTSIPQLKSLQPGDITPETFSGTNTWDGQGAGTGGANNTHIGYFSGRVNTNQWGSTFVGSQSGYNHTTGYASTFVGLNSGFATTTANWGSYFGHQSGQNNTTGYQNTYAGSLAGYTNTTGNNNAAFGHYSGGTNITGSQNTYIGSYAGTYNTGSNNTFIGYGAGFFSNSTNFGNVFLGHQAGYNETGSDKLYICNNSTATPLIWGDFGISKLVFNGKVSTGTQNQPTAVGTANTSAYTLFVKGGLLSDEVRVRTGWADYVFDKNYQLKPLSEVEAFIKANKHLPNVPSALRVENDGLNLGDMSRIQQEKIEELTLYVIEQDKKLNAQQKEIAELKVLVQKLLQQ